MSDPRIYFAAERTLLAWVRSGLTIIGLGFVISRFGLFLKVISLEAGAKTSDFHWASSALGIGLVLLGSGFILASLQNHRAYVRTLPAQDIPSLPMRWLPSLLALSLSAMGLLMAVYLAVS